MNSQNSAIPDYTKLFNNEEVRRQGEEGDMMELFIFLTVLVVLAVLLWAAVMFIEYLVTQRIDQMDDLAVTP